MQERRPALIQTLLDTFPTFLAFLVPLFFLPITSEFFEFNKLALIVVATSFMAIIWIVKMVINKKVEVVRSPLDLTLVVFVVVTVLATIFSLNKVTSLFGSQGRWFPSLFGVLALFVFYYVTASNLSSPKSLRLGVSGLGLGITLASVIGLFGYFGIKFGGAPYFQIPNFTTTGSSETVAILAVVGLILSLGQLLNTKNTTSKALYSIMASINFLTVLLLGTLPAWISLGAGLLLLVGTVGIEALTKSKSVLASLLGFALFVVLILSLPGTRSLFINSDYPKEIKISLRESWIITSSVIRDFPILGTGPSTFSINYSRYKPVSVNGQAYWNIRFDKPSSELFGVMSGMGIVGLIAAIALVAKTAKYALNSKKSKEDREITVSLGVSVLAVLTALVFAFSTITTAFVLVLLLALLVAKNRLEGINDTENTNLSLSSISKGSKMSLISNEKEIFQYIMAVPVALATLFGSYYMARQYMGEYYTRSAISAAQNNNVSLTYQMQQKAIQAFPVRDSYHNSYANTNIALANALAAKEGLSEDEKNTVQALISQAIRSSRITTEVLNPLNASNWETRALIYRALLGAAKDSGEWAIRSLNAAIQLDPTNPRLRLALGGVYYAQQDYLTAANLFNQAATLKRDYANAHYNLAQALKQLKRYPEAARALETTKKLVTEGSEDYNRVAMEQEELAKMPNVAGAVSTQPSVEEIEGVNQPAANTTPQEPLRNEGNEEALEILNTSNTQQSTQEQQPTR